MPYPFKIFQNATELFIAYEYAGAVRNIFMKTRARSSRFLDGSISGTLEGETW